MADILNQNDMLTQYELAKRINLKDAVVIELFNNEDEMNIDTPHVACNRGQVHEYIIRDTYPEAEFHGYNMGSGSNATQFRTETEGLCYADVFAKVDKKLADDSGDVAAYRSAEDEAFVKGLGRQKSYVSIYGDKNKNIYQVDGLYTRLKSRKNPHVIVFEAAPAAEDACTSIYLCALGRDKFHYLYDAKFGNTGVKRSDMGAQVAYDLPRANSKLSNGMGQIYLAHYEMQFGLAVEHPDSVWRIANVPTNPGYWNAQKREDLIDLVLEAQDYLPPGSMTQALYGNIKVKQLVEKAGREKQVVVFAEKDPWGRPVNLINGMRVRRMDAIKCGEAV
jgi:hypothetical protein